MFVSVVAAAAALNSLWQLAILYAIIRWGVDAREEAYLTRKFGAPYTPTKRKPDVMRGLGVVGLWLLCGGGGVLVGGFVYGGVCVGGL